MKLFLKCKEANHFCDKAQYKEASLLEKLKLIVHISFCTLCRRYTSRNKKLTILLEKAEVKTMPEEDKLALKERIENYLSK